jgi:hypothetical protein
MTTMTHETTRDTGQDTGELFPDPVLATHQQVETLLRCVADDRGKRGVLGYKAAKVTTTKAGWRVKGTAALGFLAGQDRITEVLRPDVKAVALDAGEDGPVRDMLRLALGRPDVDLCVVVLRRTKASLFLDVDATAYGAHEAKAPAKPKAWAPAAGDVLDLVGGELDGGRAQVWCTLADGRVVAVVDDDTQRPVMVWEDGSWERYASTAWDRWDAAQERERDGSDVYLSPGQQEHAARCEPWRLAAGLEPSRTWVMWMDHDHVIVNGVYLWLVKNGHSPFYSGGEHYAAAGMHGLRSWSPYGTSPRVQFTPPDDAEVRDAGSYYAAGARRREDWILLSNVDRALRSGETDTQGFAALWAELDRRTTPDPA